VDTGASALTFKQRLEELTGVPVARQKLMCRGGWKGILKDDTSLENLPNGADIRLMGTAEVVKEPVKAATFVEDLSAAEQAAAGETLPAGFVNLGNTCYMNSTLQCLRAVPELRTSLRGVMSNSGGQPSANPSNAFARTLAQTFEVLDSSVEAVPPAAFVEVLRRLEPQFAERNQRGYMQQDAQELFGAVYRHVASAATETKDFFSITIEEELKNTEAEEEPSVKKEDKLNMLVCNIQGGTGNTIKIDHLQEGLSLGMEGEVEKFSEVLNRNAIYKRSVKLKRLPKYICIQFMRFFWKATPNSRDHPNGIKCKIMRPVTFPEVLDVYDFCTDDLKERMKVYRDVEDKGILDHNEGEEAKEAAAGEKAGEEKGAVDEPAGEAMEMDDELKAAMEMSMQVPVDAGPGLPDDFQGNYEIFGVVTHKGREADAGHYIGWVRQEQDKWTVFDDDHVEEVDTPAILNLKGGGDWHMAYLAFYRAKN